MIDSQSVKAPSATVRGLDAAIPDSAGGQAILDAIRKRWPWVKHLFADGAYDRGKLMDRAAFLDFAIEVVTRFTNQVRHRLYPVSHLKCESSVRGIEGTSGLHVLPWRWVVERTFGWMMRWRRLVRDYEQRLDVSEAMIHIALGSLLLRRIAH